MLIAIPCVLAGTALLILGVVAYAVRREDQELSLPGQPACPAISAARRILGASSHPSAGLVLTAVGGGVISDRIGKRKMIVTVSGILIGLAAVLLTFIETWDAALVAAVLFGAGFGTYLAVDQALITQVLPAASDRAKDLGIINIAIVGPSAIGPAIAAPITAILGYPALFGATAIVAALGSVLVWRIKSVP
jgi:MFS family permease